MSTANKVIKCRAAVLWKVGKPITIEQIQVAPPKQGEVRIKVVANGLCHSDITAMKHEVLKNFPMILGHEAAGVVESVGDGVTEFQPGDHVIPLFIPQCYNCEICKTTRSNYCQCLAQTQPLGVMRDGTSRFSTSDGQTIYHFMGTSTFSEYTVTHAEALVKIDKRAPLEKVCLLGCGIPTGYGAAINTAGVHKGSTVGVWGLGTVGLSAVMGAKAAGAQRIIGIDINSNKAEIARKFGCTEFMNPNDFAGQDLAEILKEKTNGAGLDYAIECIGNPKVMRTAFDSTNKITGKTAIIGYTPKGNGVTFDGADFIYGKTVCGSIFGGWKSKDTIPKLVQDYLAKKIMIDELVTGELPLDRLHEAVELLETGKSLRTVIKY